MAKLPTDLSGFEVRVALERIGFVFSPTPGSLFPTTSNCDPARSGASLQTPVLPLNNSCSFSVGNDAAGV
jgi:hypothetical protein